MKQNTLQRFAGRLSASFLLKRGRRVWEENSRKWNLALSQWDKLLVTSYLILKDYAHGVFPPRFEDQAIAYQNEINYNTSLPGVSFADAQKGHAIKPFWPPIAARKYLQDFSRLHAILYDYGIEPRARLLELGCGSGWMAEFLALAGYAVVGTTLSHFDVALADQKVAALKARQLDEGLTFALEFVVHPMETVDEIPQASTPFDCAFVYEALHHAFDWRKTLRATANTLKPGGWFLIANEPNWLHTIRSYRVARLSNTHEIGFSKRELVTELKTAGFSTVRVLRPRIDNLVTDFWIIAQKGDRKG